MSDKVKQLVAPPLMISYLNNSLSVVLSILCLIQNKLPVEVTTSYLIFVTVLLLQLGWQCYLTDELEDLHFGIADSFYNLKNLTADAKFLTIWKLVAKRCKKPLRFSAFGFFNINLKSYRELLSAVYSYYAVLSEVVLE